MFRIRHETPDSRGQDFARATWLGNETLDHWSEATQMSMLNAPECGLVCGA